MFALAIILGIYSYVIFALGLIGKLYKENILLITLAFILFSLIYFRNNFKFKLPKLSIILGLILVLAIVNLIGALGPELGFDALWYHLTIPKIFIQNNKIFHIPGGLLYYSDMPKLGEMLYLSSLSFSNEIVAKLIHFSFGILSLFALYKISVKFLNKKFSLITVLIFYGNLVVGWQSTTAYVDLIRTFFEIMAFWGFIEWYERKDQKWLIESAVMIGLAVSTKLLSIGSIFIFVILILIVNKDRIKKMSLFVLTSLLIPLPWFIFSYLNTGNPVYPLLTQFYKTSFNIQLLNPLTLINNLWNVFMRSPDPISPMYIIFIPLIVLGYKKFNDKQRIVVFYVLFSLFVWYFTPMTGGGRFIMPYLPIFSLLVAISIKNLTKKAQLFSIYLLIVISLINVFYRSLANYKYVPVILGKESKERFLSENLNFSFGDFYDTDFYFKQHVKQSDRVLLYGFHNLYYVDFPFIDSSYVRKGDIFNYIATQNINLPNQFKFWTLVYSNNKTKVKLYSLGGQRWAY